MIVSGYRILLSSGRQFSLNEDEAAELYADLSSYLEDDLPDPDGEELPITGGSTNVVAIDNKLYRTGTLT